MWSPAVVRHDISRRASVLVGIQLCCRMPLAVKLAAAELVSSLRASLVSALELAALVSRFFSYSVLCYTLFRRRAGLSLLSFEHT